MIQRYAHSLVEGGSNLGDGKNGGNYIGGSDMPTNNVDLVDQHCRDISGWAVTQRSRFDYMYHCLNTPKEVNLTGRQVPPMTSLNVFESMQRSQVDKVLTRMAQ